MNDDQDITLVVAAALRYAMGRSSYIVPVVQGFLKRHLDNEFIKRDKELYIRDIERHLADNPATNKYTTASWEQLLADLKN